ncbi:HD domain-containing protein [Candidatus Sumerlaeota bacterium]|nr:HD domain-containing protein [Candidatus Sumerlaeota bacterium]
MTTMSADQIAEPIAKKQHHQLGKLTPGMSNIESVYHLISLEQRAKKNGEPYFTLQLGDASGQIKAIMWDNHAAMISGIVNRDDFVRVTADVGEFNGALQMTVKRIARVEEKDVEMRNYLAVSPRPLEEMQAELDAWIAKVEHRDCRKLLDRVLGKGQVRDLYCTAPAAAQIHQAYRHGLLEHTLNVVKLAESIGSMYQPVNMSFLITAGLLHDIGKIWELDWKRTITYTHKGRLLGHISMGASWIDSIINLMKRSESGFDDAAHDAIIHMILSHHGKMEWGSPVVPKTREALVLHYADRTEAYMTSFDNEARRALNRGEAWTGYSKMFESYLFAGQPNVAPTGEVGLPSPGMNGAPLMDDIYPIR